MSRKPHKYWLTRHFLVQQLSKMGLYYIFAIFYNEIEAQEREMPKAGRIQYKKEQKNTEKIQKGLRDLRFKLCMTI